MIIKSNEIKSHQGTLHSSTEHNADNKFVAAVKQCSSSRNFLSIDYVSINDVFQAVLDPSTHFTSNDVVQININDVITPYSCPDIGDIALQPKWLKCFLTWVLIHSKRVDVLSNLHLLDIFSPLIPRIEVIVLESASYMMTMRSFQYEIRVIRIPFTSDELVIRVKAKTDQTTKDVRDGRTFYLSLDKLNSSELCKRRKLDNSKFFTIAVWNCRGIGRKTFPPQLHQLLGLHSPDVLILLECKASDFMTRIALQKFKIKAFSMANPDGVAGGIAICNGKPDNVPRLVPHVIKQNKWSGIVYV